MSAPLTALRSRYERITIPTVWVGFVLSLMLHALLLSGWLPKLPLQPLDEITPGPKSNSLAVRLAPRVSALPTPPPAPAVQSRPPPPPPQQRIPPAKAPAEKILTVERPSAPSAAARPAETARPPANDDLASFIEARRRAREPAPAAPPSQPAPPSPPGETEQQRHNRIVTENLGLNVTPSFGADKNRGGGIFQVQRLGIDNAEFLFFGWNKFVNRNMQQMVEVRRGDNASIEIAVVRRMISIIREHESATFIWQSRRLGRDVSLSARMSDNAGLEDFMMTEFFPDARPRR